MHILYPKRSSLPDSFPFPGKSMPEIQYKRDLRDLARVVTVTRVTLRQKRASWLQFNETILCSEGMKPSRSNIHTLNKLAKKDHNYGTYRISSYHGSNDEDSFFVLVSTRYFAWGPLNERNGVFWQVLVAKCFTFRTHIDYPHSPSPWFTNCVTAFPWSFTNPTHFRFRLRQTSKGKTFWYTFSFQDSHYSITSHFYWGFLTRVSMFVCRTNAHELNMQSNAINPGINNLMIKQLRIQ